MQRLQYENHGPRVLDFNLYERLEPALPNISEPPMISYGLRLLDACGKHVELTYGALRVYLIVPDPADVLGLVIQGLGMPRTMHDVGLKRDVFDLLAEKYSERRMGQDKSGASDREGAGNRDIRNDGGLNAALPWLVGLSLYRHS